MAVASSLRFKLIREKEHFELLVNSIYQQIKEVMYPVSETVSPSFSFSLNKSTHTHLPVGTRGMEVDIIILTAAIAFRHVLYQFLLLLCLPIFFWSHLPPLPSGNLPDVLEQEVVIHRLVVLRLGVVALAAVYAGVLGHVHLGGVTGTGLLSHQLDNHLVAEMLQRGTRQQGSATVSGVL